jgi:hypothetical protein
MRLGLDLLLEPEPCTRCGIVLDELCGRDECDHALCLLCAWRMLSVEPLLAWKFLHHRVTCPCSKCKTEPPEDSSAGVLEHADPAVAVASEVPS